MKQYFYSDGKERFGPFSFEELMDKKITKETLIWFTGLDKWTSAKYIKEIDEFLELCPPPIIPVADNTNHNLTLPMGVLEKSEKNEKLINPLDELAISTNVPKKKKKISVVQAYILAIVACFVFFWAWALLGAWFRWENGGGPLTVIVMVFLLPIIWRTIIKLAR